MGTRGAPLATASAALPSSKGTPESTSLSPIACKNLSAGLEGAGWSGVCSSLSGVCLLGAPTALAMPQLTLTPVVPTGS